MPSGDSEPENSSLEAFKASSTSTKTVDSSNCDLREPDAAQGVDASDLAAILAAHDVTQVVRADVNAPLVTITLDEAALAPAVLLLRLPYLERLLEAVRSGPSRGTSPGFATSAHDLATYLAELAALCIAALRPAGISGTL